LVRQPSIRHNPSEVISKGEEHIVHWPDAYSTHPLSYGEHFNDLLR
jgi:hypothetical protein